MVKNCLTCRHDKVFEIEELMRRRATLEELSSKYGLTKSSLQRHRAGHFTARRSYGTKVALAELDLPVIEEGSTSERLEQLLTHANMILERASKQGSFAVANNALREVRATVVEIGRLKGEMDKKAPQDDRHKQALYYFLSMLPVDVLKELANGADAVKLFEEHKERIKAIIRAVVDGENPEKASRMQLPATAAQPCPM